MWKYDRNELCQKLEHSGKDYINVIVKMINIFINAKNDKPVQRETILYHGHFYKKDTGSYAYDLEPMSGNGQSITVSMTDNTDDLGSKVICGINKDKGSSARLFTIVGYIITDNIASEQSYDIRGCNYDHSIIVDFVKTASYKEAEAVAENLRKILSKKDGLRKTCNSFNEMISCIEIIELSTQNIAETYELTC